MVFEPCRDAVLIIIDEHLRQQRQDLKALQEGRCHMHLRDLLELRQQPAKEIPHRSRRNLQMARGPESLHERLEAPGEIRLHLVDGILYQHIAAGHIERNHALCREGNAPALLTFLHLDRKIRISLLDMYLALLQPIQHELEGLLPHDGQEAPQRPRGQFEPFPLKDLAARRIGRTKIRAVGQQAFLILPGRTQKLPKLR